MNITALALECITDGMDVADGLDAFFDYSGRELTKHLTSDPAGVSPRIKLLIDRDVAIGRLNLASKRMSEALSNPSDENAIKEALAALFWKYVEPPVGSSSKTAFANALRTGNRSVGVAGGLVTATPHSRAIKDTRSFGGGHFGQEGKGV